MSDNLNKCVGGQHDSRGDIRKLPQASGAIIAVCYIHYKDAMNARKLRNKFLPVYEQLPLPRWEELELDQEEIKPEVKS